MTGSQIVFPIADAVDRRLVESTDWSQYDSAAILSLFEGSGIAVETIGISVVDKTDLVDREFFITSFRFVTSSTYGTDSTFVAVNVVIPGVGAAVFTDGSTGICQTLRLRAEEFTDFLATHPELDAQFPVIHCKRGLRVSEYSYRADKKTGLPILDENGRIVSVKPGDGYTGPTGTGKTYYLA